MPKYILLTLLSFLTLTLHAADTTLATSVQFINFSHSVQKKDGQKYMLHLTHNSGSEHYHLAYERGDTRTYQPPLPDNLHVDKLFLHYAHVFKPKQSLHLHFSTIDDNLAKETDGGRIYGVGYHYGHFHVTQYLSDYHHFDVWQSDLLYKMHRPTALGNLRIVLLAKYIHLTDKNSNGFSKNAKTDYFTPGINLHLHNAHLFSEVGAFFGKRVFAVMQNGFAVQHHAMEFTQTYMAGIGKVFANYSIRLGYSYMRANELPLHNKGVTISNLALSFVYRFGK